MSKKIDLSDDAYNAVVAAKRPDEDFYELILRLVAHYRRPRSISESAGTWPMTRKEGDQLTKAIYAQRGRSGEGRPFR